MIKLEISFSSIEDLKFFISSHNETKIKNIADLARAEIRQNKKWTQFEDNYIIDNFFKYKARVIAKSLNRSLSSVFTRIQKLKKENLLKNKFPRNSNVIEKKEESDITKMYYDL